MSKTRTAIDALPELPLEPFEVAGTLAHARRGPYVTIVPHPRPVPAPPPPPPHAVSKGSFDTRFYYTQVIYPRVFCTSPGELADGLELPSALNAAAPLAPNDPRALAAEERHYKLSALHGKRFISPLFCTVKGGPWTGFVVETESCIDGVPNRWELTVSGIPEIDLVWYGQWLDQPSLPNLIVIKNDLFMVNHTSACCAGHKWCATTGSCIPDRVNCQGTTPA